MDVLTDSKTCPVCQGTFPSDLEVCPRDGGALEEAGEWSVGQVIEAKYVVFRPAEGDPAAAAYRVRALELDEPRLLRVLRAPLAREAAAVREFRRAGRLLEQAAHPNLARVERVGADDGRPFLVTEPLEGRTLDDLLRAEGPLGPARAREVARQVAAALESLHRTGLLHLALEARNVVLAGAPEDERVKLQGTGSAYAWMARAAGCSPRAGNEELAAVSLRERMPLAPAYSSPEQALGCGLEALDARADLYALGVLLYRMLAGRLPVEPAAARSGRDAAALAWLSAHLNQEPRPLDAQEHGRDIPPPLAALTMKLLEKRPELRPATARAVLDELEIAAAPVAARVAVAPEPPPSAAAESRGEEEPTELASAEPERAAAPARPARSRAGPLTAARAAAERERALADFALKGAPAAAGGPLPEAAGAPGGPEGQEVPPAEGAARTPPGEALFTSPLFQPPPPVSRARWVLAIVSVLVVAGGVWFFATRARNGWMGAGPANRLKPEELRAVEGADSNAPANASPQGATQSQPAGSTPANAAATAPASAAPLAGRAAGQPGAQAAGSAPHATQAPPAVNPAGPPAAKPAAGAAARNAGPPAAPALDPDEVASQVQRAIDTGDVFFGLGKYDLAIRAYEVPLQLDPKNKLLLARIERAKKAKAAEEQFLQQ